jgi:polyisoprenoid-binding protein YceI
MTAADTQTQTTLWTIDPNHSTVEFSAKHMMFATVKGRFGSVSGTIDFDPANPTAGSVNVEIDAASVDTRVADRDKHLRSADFFDVENFPKLTFRSTRIEQKDDEFIVYGDLTIRDVTREVALETEFQGVGKSPWGQEVAGFEAKTKINRTDFGLTWNTALESGGVLVGDEIKINIYVEALR